MLITLGDFACYMVFSGVLPSVLTMSENKTRKHDCKPKVQ